MRTGGDGNGSTSMRRLRAWVGVIAVAMGVTVARPAQAQAPKGKAPAAVSSGLEEAKRLDTEVRRLHWLGKYDEALPFAQRAVAILEKALGPGHLQIATSLNNLAALYHEKGDYARAEPLQQRAMAIQEKALGSNHPDVAASLSSLAALYHEKGDYVRALPLQERALAILEKALGPNHTRVALSLNNLALLYSRKGDYIRAEPLFLRALAILEKAFDPDIVESLNGLAVLYTEKGDYGRAEALFRAALTIKVTFLPHGHPDVAVSLNNLAAVLQEKGEYARAEPLLQRALAIREKAFGPKHPFVARSLTSLAIQYALMGDHARAVTLLQRALAVFEKALGPDHPMVVTVLGNLAALHYGRGDYARAEPLLQLVLAISEKALGADHREVGMCFNSLAVLYEAQGDYGRAEPLFQRALAIMEKATGADHPQVAKILNNLGGLHQHRGDYARAEPFYQRALAIVEKALGPDHPVVATFVSNLAVLYTRQRRVVEAVNASRRATDIQDRNALAVLTIGSEERKRLYMATLACQTHGVVSLHLQHAPSDFAAARVALTTLLRRKGRVLDAMTDSFAALGRSLSPADRGLLDRLALVYSQLATQASRGPGNVPLEQYRKNLAALEKERQTLESNVTRRSAAFRAEQHLVALVEVQAAIPEGSALVEIVRYRPFHPRTTVPSNPWGAPRYAAYILHRRGDPTFTDLGEAAAIDAATDKLRLALADHDRTHDPKPAARALDRLLMEPIRKHLGDTRWVFVSPDGPLHLIPFGALVDEEGHYLVERYLFSYLTTGRDLLRFSDMRPAPRSAPLVLANPAFDHSGAPALPGATHRGVRSIDMVTQRLPSLENTVEEARTIAQLFPRSRVLLGAEATEEAVKATHAPHILHLATHGFFLPEQPVPDVLLHRGPGGEPGPEERAALLQRENPLLRSAIALAGFNRRQSGSDDGVLTALEVTGLDLHGTRLVVLSACESGVGQATSGEGVYGLRRALVIAGSETQVMSLWQVDTGRTRELMQAYYQRLRDGSGRSEAMREVQLAMLAEAETAHPNVWAGFITSGDWRTLEGQARLPDVGKVPPGLRGCSCRQAGGEPSAYGGWLALALGLAAVGRRRFGHARVARSVRSSFKESSCSASSSLLS